MGTKAPEAAGKLHRDPDHAEPERPVEREPARRLTVVRGIITRSLYLDSAPDPVFAMAHLPSTIADDATGVVLCPPFGWAEICTYRTRRVWADALARTGHPAIRIDLPGTGDSAGSPRDPGRLAAWTGAVAAAASWLRDEGECRRVAGLGVSFGGMLAWLAASEGAPIDDLVLWAVPTRGRRLLREMRASAMIQIDSHTEFENAPATEPRDPRDGPDDDGLLDMAGRIMTSETVDSLARLDLTTLPLADPTQRRVLLFEGDGVAFDQRLHDYFEASGAEVAVASGEGYGAMMQYARYAQTPEAAIARSISWLSESAAAGRRRPSAAGDAPSAPVDALPTLELWHDNVAIRETPMTIETGSGSVFGILTEPVGVSRAEVCAVLFNAGSDRRTGPNRAWVETARRWAAQGVPTVRIDQPGVGDADGEERDYDDIAAYYDPRITARTITIMDGLQARGLPGRFALVGFCAGGYWSLQAALADERVAGAFAINLPCFFWTWWARNVLHGRWVHRRPRPDDSRTVASALWALRTVSRALPRARRVHFGMVRRGPRRLDQAMIELRDRGTEVLLMFRPSEPLYLEMQRDGVVDRLDDLPNVDVRRIPGADHTFRPLPLQRYVSTELDAGLRRVLRAQASSVTGSSGRA